jgi:molybdenum cofactor synthesis domain-containing protein
VESKVRGVAPLKTKVLTVSDGVIGGTREDRSGAALAELLSNEGFEVVERAVCPDGIDHELMAISNMVEGFSGLIVTTGGTGFGPRDLTPEGTQRVIERAAPGLAEAIRAASPLGRLSRGVSGTAGSCLILNLPGSPGGAIESIGAVLDVLPHALELLAGKPDPHPSVERPAPQ